ncbi:hypothetical protein [Falsiroseomonas sp.]|jgi:hypothetical protein|uniref:hypothetical protein n=1 Tax=Falsiroseomonas sp. TaxID=2870721 RepID=UPI003F6F1124
MVRKRAAAAALALGLAATSAATAQVPREAEGCYDLMVGLTRWGEAMTRACRADSSMAETLRLHADAGERRFEELFGSAALAAARQRLGQALQRSVQGDPQSCAQLGNRPPLTIDQQRDMEAELARMVPDWSRFAFRPVPGAMACE